MVSWNFMNLFIGAAFLFATIRNYNTMTSLGTIVGILTGLAFVAIALLDLLGLMPRPWVYSSSRAIFGIAMIIAGTGKLFIDVWPQTRWARTLIVLAGVVVISCSLSVFY